MPASARSPQTAQELNDSVILVLLSFEDSECSPQSILIFLTLFGSK